MGSTARKRRFPGVSRVESIYLFNVLSRPERRLVPLVEEDVREHPGAEGEGEDQ